MTRPRRLSPLDRLLSEAQRGISGMADDAIAMRENPGAPQPDVEMAHRQRQHAALYAAIGRAALPRAARALPPLGDHAIEPAFLAFFRAECLDDGVATDGVGERAAHARVPQIAETRGRRDVA